MDELVEMKAVGVTPDDVQRWRRAGYGQLTPEKLVELKAVGGDPDNDDDVGDDPDPDPDDGS